jgi:hypothetical protein
LAGIAVEGDTYTVDPDDLATGELASPVWLDRVRDAE